MLARLARFAYRHRKLMVFGIWLPLLIIVNMLSSSIGTDYRSEFEMPNSESKRVQDAFSAAGNEEDAGYAAQIVFTAAQGTDDPAVVAAMTDMLTEVDAIETVKVISPYSPEGGQQISALHARTTRTRTD